MGGPDDHLSRRGDGTTSSTRIASSSAEQWVTPSSDSKINVIDSHSEQVFLTVAEAQAPDIDRAVTAAKEAFDHGPWPRLTHAERAAYLRALGDEVVKRSADIVQMWPREAGVIAAMAGGAAFGAKHTFDYYADLADTFEWERPVRPSRGGFGLVVKEPVGVVGAIIPWNAPMGLISMKLAPALIAGCTVVLKTSPEAPGEGYVISEAAEAVGLPPGVLNVLCADREVSELLVRDPRVDKITFTGSTAAGRRIASICGERIARVTLELGGKSAAVILDDADIESTAPRHWRKPSASCPARSARRSPGSWSPGHGTTRCSRPWRPRSPR